MLELSKNYELIFYDQRGSGKSLENNIDSKYISLDQFTKDLEDLRRNLGLTKFSLIGHFWGGILSINYAAKYSDNISSLILLNPGPTDFHEYKALGEKLDNAIKHRIEPLFNYDMFRQLSKKSINQLYKDLFSVYFKNSSSIAKLTFDVSKESAISGLNIFKSLNENFLQTNYNLLTELNDIRTSSLIIHGLQDIIPVENAEKKYYMQFLTLK